MDEMYHDSGKRIRMPLRFFSDIATREKIIKSQRRLILFSIARKSFAEARVDMLSEYS